MSLHLSLRPRARLGVPYCCTSLTLQPAAVVQRPCSTACSMSRYLSPPLSKPMQGKIKGRGTMVRVKPVCTRGGRGTRGRGYRAVCCAVPASEKRVIQWIIER